MDQLILSVPDDNAYWQRIYSKSLAHSDQWVESARMLRQASQSLSADLKRGWLQLVEGSGPFPIALKQQPVFLMLCAYAAENYLKARIAVVSGLTEENIGTKLPKVLKSHNVTALTTTAGLILNAEEADICDRLTVYGIWAGRYPAPVDRDDLRPQTIGAHTTLPTFFRGSDIAVAECLLEKLDTLVQSGSVPDIQRSRSKYDGVTIQERVTPW